MDVPAKHERMDFLCICPKCGTVDQLANFIEKHYEDLDMRCPNGACNYMLDFYTGVFDYDLDETEPEELEQRFLQGVTYMNAKFGEEEL